MNTLTIAIMSIALSVAAQFSLKLGMSSAALKEIISQPFSLRVALAVLSEKYVLTGFVLYGLGALVWLGVLSKWDVSKAYPLVGLGFAFAVAIGFMIGEQVTMARVIGVILICTGVYLVGQS
jgi:multidrug transporter EmrE-like cation transporter